VRRCRRSFDFVAGAMRERSHKKGELYQQDVKKWLAQGRFLGFDVELFGDAYDVTKKACTLGEVVFDFSLKLSRGKVTRRVLYCECKYRDERKGNVNTDFREFLKRACRALSAAEADDAENAVFAFVSTLPPDDWRKYLKNKRKYCKDDLGWEENEAPSEGVLDQVASVVHLLVLSARIVAGE
jgi:hypothetical protein